MVRLSSTLAIFAFAASLASGSGASGHELLWPDISCFGRPTPFSRIWVRYSRRSQIRSREADRVGHSAFHVGSTGEHPKLNPGAERLKGHTADEIIGNHFSSRGG